MSLTPQKQAISDLLKQHITESDALSALEIATTLTEQGHFPNGAPDQGAASAMMTNAFRAIPGLKRVKRDGSPAFVYYYDEEADAQMELVSSRKAPAKMQATMIPSMVPSPTKTVRPASVKVRAVKNGPFVIVKKVDGSFAGVLVDNVLHESLEELVTTLNKQYIG